MANEVMQTLFGLDSQSAAAALRRQQQAEDVAYAQLDPRQQIVFNARQAGRSVGSGLNQLFGLVPEPLQRVRLIEGALAEAQSSGVDFADPEASTKAVIQALSNRGLNSEATMVAMAYQENLPKLLKAQQDKVVGTANERGQSIANKVEDALVSGAELDSAQVRTALNWLLGVTSDKTTYVEDTYGNTVPKTIAGNKGYLALYPSLAKLLLGMPTAVEPNAGATMPNVEATMPNVEAAMPPVAQASTQPTTYPLLTDKFTGIPLPDESVPLPRGAASMSPPPATTPAISATAPKAQVAAPVAPVTAPAASPTNRPVPPKQPAVWNSQTEREYKNALAAYEAEVQAKAAEAQQRHNQAVLKLEQEKAAREQEKAAREQLKEERAMQNMLNNTVESTNTALALITEAVEIIRRNPRMSTGWGALTASLPSSDARSLANKLESLRGSVALKAMQQLKEASPTGSTGFGSMSIPELMLVQSRFGTMDQADDPKQLLADLRRVAEAMWNGRKAASQGLVDMRKTTPKGK